MENRAKKICEIMMWGIPKDTTAMDVLEARNIKEDNIPDERIIEVVHSGGLDVWTRKQVDVTSFENLVSRVTNIIVRTINSSALSNPATKNKFPLIQHFHTQCSNLAKRGAIDKEARKMAEDAWHVHLAALKLKQQIAEMYKDPPDKEKFKTAVKRIKQVWGFSDVDIEAIKYFTLQSLTDGFNPSLNKHLYFWGKEKGTGKTTIAKMIVAVLNGEKDLRNIGKYESKLAKELQYNVHDVPLSTFCNAVFLDEQVPKDSSRSYGQVKQMLTSSTCDINIKFGAQIKINAKKNYIFASNNDVSDFVQDESERRFYGIEIIEKPIQLKMKEIYQIWIDFCTNAEREKDWDEWYNEFEYIEGKEARDKEYYKLAILTSPSLRIEINAVEGYYLSPPFFIDNIIKGKPTRDERRLIIESLIDLFKEPPYPSRWKKSDVKEIIFNSMTPEELEDKRRQIKELPF